MLSSLGAMVLAVAYLMPLVYFAWSLRYGKPAGSDPWHATGLEWRVPSPPPTKNFETVPTVEEEPYQYHEEGVAPRHAQAPHRRQGG